MACRLSVELGPLCAKFKSLDCSGHGSTGQIKKASFFGRAVKVQGKKMNAGSLVDFLNEQVMEDKKLEKGWFFGYGGSSNAEIKNLFYDIYPNTASDREAVLSAVQQDGLSLECASDALKNDKDVVLEAIKNNGKSLEFAGDELKNDRAFLLEAIKNNGEALKFVSGAFKDNRYFVLNAVRKNGLALEFASDELNDDEDIVLIAVMQNGLALEFASKNLKDYRYIVLVAVRQNASAIEFASKRVKDELKAVNKTLVSVA